MSGDSGPVVPSEPDSATPEPARTLRGLLRNLKGPAGYGVILSLYVVIGGLAWLIIQSQPARQSVQPAIDPRPAAEPTRAAELTVVATAVPAPVVEPLPTAAVRPAPPARQYAVDPPPQGKFILIDQDRQTMFLFEEGTEVQRYPISSGVPGSRLTDTPQWTGHISHYVGTFFAYGGYADHAWYLFKDYVGDILIHGAPYNYVGGKKVYEDLDKLGRAPASHGCIRMSPEAIGQLGLWGPQGVLVHITPWTGNGPARLPAGS